MIKALGPSDRLPAWRSIEVRQEAGGRCTLRLSGHAAELARQSHLVEFAVSLTHEGPFAAAVVVALGADDDMTELRSALLQSGLLFETGVDGLYGRSGTFE